MKNLGFYEPGFTASGKPTLSRQLFEEIKRIVTASRRSPLNKLTKAEIRLLLDYLDLGPVIALSIKQANNETKKRFGSDCRANRGNAFKHAYWNALMATYISVIPNVADGLRPFGPVGGVAIAKLFADAHESEVNQNNEREVRETAADLINNAIGRKVFLENTSASADKLADLLAKYPVVYEPEPERRAGSTDALVYVEEGCNQSDIVYVADGGLVENGYRGFSDPNAEIQAKRFAKPLGPLAVWNETTSVLYGPQFSGANYIRGKIGAEITMEGQSENKLDHPGGGLIAFNGISASANVRVYVTDPSKVYKLNFTRTSSTVSTNSVNDGNPWGNRPNVECKLSVNGQSYPGDSVNSIEIRGDPGVTVVGGQRLHYAGTISMYLGSGAGFTAIIGVPPVETVSRATMTVKASVRLIASP